ncbi:hypothetical protein Ddye_000924, partial [Dipteronia dyeriana]
MSQQQSKVSQASSLASTNRDTTFVLKVSDSESFLEYFASSDMDFILESYQATQTNSQQGPQVPIQIPSEKYSKPVKAIVYIDTGSHNTVMNPIILLSKAWKVHVQYFKAKDGQ